MRSVTLPRAPKPPNTLPILSSILIHIPILIPQFNMVRKDPIFEARTNVKVSYR